ncbi:MAG: GNAT family N-acetyltransferase [Actinobacteria bacterium]|nr:GNAT family N-acetyltransferase [Actinomycetota bacterium]
MDEQDAAGITGFVAVGGCRDEDAPSRTGEVHAIYVDPAHWGRGAGSRLLSAGLDLLAAAGHRRATLWVLESNHRTRTFYEDRGWSADGGARSERRGDVTLFELRYARPLSATRGTPDE